MTTELQRRARSGRAAVEAVASPARQELLLALGEGRASVRELAARLGRSRSALHYHVGLLERAGMIECVDVRGSGREREAVYARTRAAGARARTPAERDGARRAGQAMLRLTQRELTRAIDDVNAGRAAAGRTFAGRGKARLDRARLARAHELIGELMALFDDAPAEPGPAAPLYAVTVVLTPSRDASARRGR